MYEAQQFKKIAKSLHLNIRRTLCTVNACRCMYVTKESTCRESKLKPNFLQFPMKNWAHHFAKRSRSLLEIELTFLSWKWADFFLKKGPFHLLKIHILFLKKTTSSLEKEPSSLCEKKSPFSTSKTLLVFEIVYFSLKAEATFLLKIAYLFLTPRVS
jgi:hypothetical protein